MVNPDYNGKSRPSKFAIYCPNCITRTLFDIKLVNCNTSFVFIRGDRILITKCLLASS